MELVIFRDSKEVGRLRLSEGSFSIGRGLHNTIALDEQGVSRRHARIRVENGRVLAADLGSVNGTLLHGKPLREETELESGDVLEIGPYFIQAILDDDFVSHEMERTESHASLKALERQAQEDSRDTSSPARKTTPDSAAPAADDHSECLGPHELFGLTEDGWLEHDATKPDEPAPAGEPSSSRGRSDDAREQLLEIVEGDGILLPVDDIFPSDEDDIELIEITDQQEEPAGPKPDQGAQTAGEELNYDDWKPATQTPTETPTLPHTLNLAEQGSQAEDDRAAAEPTNARDPDIPRLVVRQGFARQDHYELGDGTLYIGRAEEMDIVLLDTNASRRHAAVSREQSGYVIRDLWSLNGIEVNGERRDAALLKHGDQVRIGDTVLEFDWPAQAVAAAQAGLSRPWPGIEEETGRAEAVRGGEAQADGPQSEAKGGAVVPGREPPEASGERRKETEAVHEVRVPGKARHGVRRRTHFFTVPTLVVAFTTMAIVLTVGVIVLTRDRHREGAGASGRSEPPLSLESLRLMAQAEAELDVGDYQRALDLATLVQTKQPGSQRAARLIREVCESWTMAWLLNSLGGRSEDPLHPGPGITVTPPVTPVPTPLPPEEPPESAVRPTDHRDSAPSGTPAPVRVASVSTNPRESGRTTRPAVKRGEESRRPETRAKAGAGSTRDQQVARLYEQGLRARDQGRYLEAVQAFEQAKSQDPFRESELYYTIEDEMKRAVAALHEQVRPLVGEAAALERDGRLTEARQKLAEAVSRDPYYSPAVARLRQIENRLAEQAREVLGEAQAREKEGDLDDAARLYRKVLTLVPDPSNVYHQEAALRLEQLE